MTNQLTTEQKLLAAHSEIAKLRAELATRKSFIVGAADHAAGKFFGFGGQGSMRRDTLLNIIVAAGMEADIAPGVKSAHAQAGEAVSRLNGRGYVVRTDKARETRDANGQVIPRAWRARWIVAQQNGAGFDTCGTVSLTNDGKLEFSATFPAGLAAGISGDFEQLVADKTYDATDISTWLRGLFVVNFRGVLVGSNWYVRSQHVEGAERLCSILSRTWGRNWLLPAVPMIASDELSEGIVQSFIADAAMVMDRFACERAASLEDGIGKRRAASLLGEVRDLIERAAGFVVMFGEKRATTVKAKLVAIANEIQQATDDVMSSNAKIFDAVALDTIGSTVK